MATEAPGGAEERGLKRVARFISPVTDPGAPVAERAVAIGRSAGILGGGAAALSLGTIAVGPEVIHALTPIAVATGPADLVFGGAAVLTLLAQPLVVSLTHDPNDWYGSDKGLTNRRKLHGWMRRVQTGGVVVGGATAITAAAMAVTGHGGADPGLIAAAAGSLGVALGAASANRTLWRSGRPQPAQRQLAE